MIVTFPLAPMLCSASFCKLMMPHHTTIVLLVTFRCRGKRQAKNFFFVCFWMGVCCICTKVTKLNPQLKSVFSSHVYLRVKYHIGRSLSLLKRKAHTATQLLCFFSLMSFIVFFVGTGIYSQLKHSYLHVFSMRDKWLFFTVG